MELNSLVKQFISLEKDENLFTCRVKGALAWDFIRYAVFYAIYQQLYRADEIVFKKEKKISKILREIWLYPIILFKSALTIIKKTKYEIFIINYDKNNSTLDNKEINVTFYPIVKTFNKDHKMLFLDPSKFSRRKAKDYSCDVLAIRGLTWFTRIFAKTVHYTSEEQNIFNKIQDAIRKTFNVEIDFKSIVYHFFSRQYLEYKFYKFLFARFKPKLIFLADTAGYKGLINAAHVNKISVVDLQHSLMSSTNILYQYPDNVDKHELPTLSDRIFTFGVYWNDKYHLPVKRIAVGYPFLEMKKEEIEKKKLKKKKSILFISSMHSGKKLEKLALELSESLLDYEIIYKLRPEEYLKWREVYSEEFAHRDNITIIDDNNTSLYEYFAMASYQIGINSTALVEGMSFDLTTFVFKDGWYKEMESLINAKFVHLVSSEQDIVSFIKNENSIIERPSQEMIFKSNSLNNIKKQISTLLEKNSHYKKEAA